MVKLLAVCKICLSRFNQSAKFLLLLIQKLFQQEVYKIYLNIIPHYLYGGFPGGSVGKASAYNAGDPGLIPGFGRSPGEGMGNPLQHSCLENPMDRGAWQATVHGVPKSWTCLRTYTFIFMYICESFIVSHLKHFIEVCRR